jgi:hypothetical protein
MPLTRGTAFDNAELRMSNHVAALIGARAGAAVIPARVRLHGRALRFSITKNPFALFDCCVFYSTASPRFRACGQVRVNQKRDARLRTPRSTGDIRRD